MTAGQFWIHAVQLAAEAYPGGDPRRVGRRQPDERVKLRKTIVCRLIYVRGRASRWSGDDPVRPLRSFGPDRSACNMTEAPGSRHASLCIDFGASRRIIGTKDNLRAPARSEYSAPVSAGSATRGRVAVGQEPATFPTRNWARAAPISTRSGSFRRKNRFEVPARCGSRPVRAPTVIR